MTACQDGSSLHVFALGAACCSVCGWNRWPTLVDRLEGASAARAAARVDPLTFACPVCHATPQHHCVTHGGKPRVFHVARRRLAGEVIASPPTTPAQDLARRRNWFRRSVRGAISNLSAGTAPPLSPAERAALDTALAALTTLLNKERHG